MYVLYLFFLKSLKQDILHIQGQRADPDSAVSSSRQVADVGAVISNLKSVLKLISERVMLVPDCKRTVTQLLNALLSEKGTDPSVLLCILDVLKGWIEDDLSKPGTSGPSSAFLTPKEILSFLQKLSQVDKQNFSPSAVEEWDRKYLQLLYGICADSDKYVPCFEFIVIIFDYNTRNMIG